MVIGISINNGYDKMVLNRSVNTDLELFYLIKFKEMYEAGRTLTGQRILNLHDVYEEGD